MATRKTSAKKKPSLTRYRLSQLAEWESLTSNVGANPLPKGSRRADQNLLKEIQRLKSLTPSQFDSRDWRWIRKTIKRVSELKRSRAKGKRALVSAFGYEPPKRKRAKPKAKKKAKAKPKKAPTSDAPSDVSEDFTPNTGPQARDWYRSIIRGVRDLLADGAVRVVINNDNTVDGELKIPVPPDDDIRDFLLEIENLADWSQFQWISVGLEFDKTISEEGLDAVYEIPSATVRAQYLRGTGSDVAIAHSQTGERAGENFITAREIASRQERYGRKVNHVIIRVHWSEEGKRPER